jgi:alkanesulfonate monooxygenase SsuD/methylene tetrahydromethanopterin reductase-like flavin-dependent oxidoreductase (luciferase family)
VILPWNDPLRVAEKLSMLDHLSNGRCIAGFGRGLSKMEYAHFGIPMDESRDRFDEALPMVLEALRSGTISGAGTFYKQVPTPVHPKPRASLADDFCSVGMSPDSATVAGQIGAKLLSFITKPTPDMMPLFNCYLEAFRANHPGRTPHIIMDDFYMVRESADEAFELGMKYTSSYYRTVVRHYEFDGAHFANTKGYTAYAEGAEQLRAAGIEAAAEAYVKAQLGVGSPRQILERLEERLSYLGPDISMAGCFFYGGMTRDEAFASLKLFGSDVIDKARAMAAACRQPVGAA